MTVHTGQKEQGESHMGSEEVQGNEVESAISSLGTWL